MTALLHAEARKLVATRSWLLLAAAAVVYPLLVVAGAAATGTSVADTQIHTVVRGGADVAKVAMLILGVLVLAGEYRHGTIVPSLLAAPRRGAYIGAKLSFQASLGAGVGLATAVVGLVAGGAYLASEGVAVDILSGDVALTTAGVVIVTMFYAVAGGALGAIVRNQTAAATAALLWLLAVEEAVPIVLRNPGLRRWLPGGASTRLLQLADPAPAAMSAWAAVLVLGAVAGVLTLAAVVTTVRSDID